MIAELQSKQYYLKDLGSHIFELVLVKRLNENGHSAAAISILWPRGGVGCLLTLLGLWYLGILVVRSSLSILKSI